MTARLEICRERLAPMEIGSTCEACHHPAPSHSNDGPCVMCWVKVKVANLEQRISDAVDRESDQ